MFSGTLKVVAVGILINVAITYYAIYNDCVDDQMMHHTRLQDQVCRNVYKQLELGMQDKCNESRKALVVGPMACAWKRTWEQGEIMRVWNTATDSGWKMLASFTVIVLFFIYELFHTPWLASAKLKKHKKKNKTPYMLMAPSTPAYYNRRERVYEILNK